MNAPSFFERAFAVIGSILLLVACAVTVGAQAPAQGTAKPAAPAQPAAAKPAAAASSARIHANLNQVMRAILFFNSNVIFSAQSEDPAKIERDKDPSSSTDPLKSTYGGWDAVENASLALAEAANLLTIPGRRCSNGKPAPVGNADWVKFVAGLRDAGMTAYKAAQSKNMDRIVDAADVVSTACANCHDVYREKSEKQGGMAARCTK